MRRLLAGIPRHVQMSVVALLVIGALFGLAFAFLGGALDQENADNVRLKADIAKANKDLGQVADDHQFVLDNRARFEELLQNGRLVPHTRRAAVVVLQDVAKASGLTAMEYNFGSSGGGATSAGAAGKVLPKQTSGNAFSVSVENVELKLGSATDGAIYRFLSSIDKSFPGSVVLQSLSITRADRVSADALRALSEGKDSRLVSGEAKIIWRTAQAEEQKTAEKAK